MLESSPFPFVIFVFRGEGEGGGQVLLPALRWSLFALARGESPLRGLSFFPSLSFSSRSYLDLSVSISLSESFFRCFNSFPGPGGFARSGPIYTHTYTHARTQAHVCAHSPNEKTESDS